MTIFPISILTVISSVCVLPGLAQTLPYNPTYLIQGPESKIYQFSTSSSPQFGYYDANKAINASEIPTTITQTLPFLSNSSNAFVPVAVDGGIQVFSGECSLEAQELSLWSYNYTSKNHTWTQLQTSSTDPSISANFLSAAFTFPSSGAQTDDTLYVFGGMCPSGNGSVASWTQAASYSNTVLTIAMEAANDYEVSLTGQRAPPVAEAGLSITPLNSSNVGSSLQQNFVLIGGHTQTAFISMNQIAMFSLPQQAWAFIDVSQPAGTSIEPRSGHTAVMSQDGSQIFVFGGWVGNVTNPATPALAILEVGQGYGGNGSWAWTIPQQTSGPFVSGQGVYGHGATMLPGGVMMVTGGFSISNTNSKLKRAASEIMFYNTSSGKWLPSYKNSVNPTAVGTSTGKLGTPQKAGLGVGLALGIAVLIVGIVICYFYLRRKRQEKVARERALREMALGTDYGGSVRAESRATNLDTRSVSWGARQEQRIETLGPKQPWFSMNIGKPGSQPTVLPESARVIDRSGVMLDVPSPTRGLRKNLHSRGTPGFGVHQFAMPGIPMIAEEDEDRSREGSIRHVRTSNDDSARPLSDPFKDPPLILPNDEAAEQRKQEVQKWVEDWNTAAQTMSTSRSNSKAHARTNSNLSANNASSSSEYSDRTGSNLSEKSDWTTLSFQKSTTETLSRNVSQRSASAGYALFSSASAAMSRMAGRSQDPNPAISNMPPSAMNRGNSRASKRSISTGDLAELAARKRSNSIEQNNLSSSSRYNTLAAHEEEVVNDYWTPPESPTKFDSPIKDYKRTRQRSSSLTNSSKKALGALSQVTRRVLTGTSHVSVAEKVSDFETRSGSSSPTKLVGVSDMTEVSSSTATSTGATFWQHKQGAKDWNALNPQSESSRNIRRRSGRDTFGDDQRDDYLMGEDGEDWDPEQAIQQRVVQVMFTVPKEKLRVVNADSLSLVSRSDTNASRESRKSLEGIIEAMPDGLAESRQENIAHETLFSTHNRFSESSAWKGKERLLQRKRSADTVGTIGKAF